MLREGEAPEAGRLSFVHFPPSPRQNGHLALTDLTRKTYFSCQPFPGWEPTSLIPRRYGQRTTLINPEARGSNSALSCLAATDTIPQRQGFRGHSNLEQRRRCFA